VGRSSFTWISVLAAAWALAGAGACGIRPLTSAELYGVSATGGTTGAAGTGGTGGPPGAAGTAGTTNDAAQDMTIDMTVDADTPETPPADGGTDAPASGCPQSCAADQFCDELTNKCSPRAGTGMLSGSVIDTCDGNGLDALVGIAGQHQCSYPLKGSFFFTGLPLGRLNLAAAKDGYTAYSEPVEIVPGGVIHNIRLTRKQGCSVAPAAAACTCTEPTCPP
jgi:hypothetical protein